MELIGDGAPNVRIIKLKRFIIYNHKSSKNHFIRLSWRSLWDLLKQYALQTKIILLILWGILQLDKAVETI